MKSRFQCTLCFNKISAPEGLVGRHVACPMCEQRLQVPPADPERMMLEQQVYYALDHFKISDWDRLYGKKCLEMRVVKEGKVGQAAVTVRSAVRRGRKLSMGEELLRIGAIDRENDLAIKELVKGAAKAMGKLKECANCFEAIPADARSCPYCGQERGDLKIIDMCPACKHEQPRGERICGACGADMLTGLKTWGNVDRCGRCGQIASAVQDKCEICGTPLDKSEAQIRREDKVKRVKEWFAANSGFLILACLIVTGVVIWWNWPAIRRAAGVATAGEQKTALRERLDRFDKALKFRDLDALTMMIDSRLRVRAGERERTVILGGKDAARVVKQVEAIEHEEINLGEQPGEATVYTRVTGRYGPAAGPRPGVRSSADIPALVAGGSRGGSRDALSVQVTWKWVLRDNKWYYAAPLPEKPKP